MAVFAFCCHLGTSWARLGASEAHLGTSWRRLGLVLGASLAIFPAMFLPFPIHVPKGMRATHSHGRLGMGLGGAWALFKKDLHLDRPLHQLFLILSTLTHFRRELEPWILSLLSRFLAMLERLGLRRRGRVDEQKTMSLAMFPTMFLAIDSQPCSRVQGGAWGRMLLKILKLGGAYPLH